MVLGSGTAKVAPVHLDVTGARPADSADGDPGTETYNQLSARLNNLRPSELARAFNSRFKLSDADSEGSFSPLGMVVRFFVAICLGWVIGVMSTFMYVAVRFIDHVYRERLGNVVVDLFGGHWAWLLLHITAGTAISGLVVGYIARRYVPECIGDGMIAVRICLAVSSPIPLRVAAFRVGLSLMYCGMGNPLDIEAPILHVSSAVASVVQSALTIAQNSSSYFDDGALFPDVDLPFYIVMAWAAGLSSAFNAPMAGVVYAMEEFMDVRQNGHATALVLCCSICANLVWRLIVSRRVLIDMDDPLTPGAALLGSDLLPWTIIALLVGICSGLLSTVFTRVTLAFRQICHKQPWIGLEYVGGVAGLCAGIFGAAVYCLTGLVDDNPDHRITGVWGPGDRSALEILKDGSYSPTAKLIFIVGKLMACAFAVAAGGSGGFLIPSVVMGSMLGDLLEDVFVLVDPERAHRYSMASILGMAAMLSGVTHLPLTAAVAIYEMTSVGESYGSNGLFPVMVASVTSYFVAHSSDKESIVESMMTQDGINTKALTKVLQEALRRSIHKDDDTNSPATSSGSPVMTVQSQSRRTSGLSHRSSQLSVSSSRRSSGLRAEIKSEEDKSSSGGMRSECSQSVNQLFMGGSDAPTPDSPPSSPVSPSRRMQAKLEEPENMHRRLSANSQTSSYLSVQSDPVSPSRRLQAKLEEPESMHRRLSANSHTSSDICVQSEFGFDSGAKPLGSLAMLREAMNRRPSYRSDPGSLLQIPFLDLDAGGSDDKSPQSPLSAPIQLPFSHFQAGSAAANHDVSPSSVQHSAGSPRRNSERVSSGESPRHSERASEAESPTLARNREKKKERSSRASHRKSKSKSQGSRENEKDQERDAAEPDAVHPAWRMLLPSSEVPKTTPKQQPGPQTQATSSEAQQVTQATQQSHVWHHSGTPSSPSHNSGPKRGSVRHHSGTSSSSSHSGFVSLAKIQSNDFGTREESPQAFSKQGSDGEHSDERIVPRQGSKVRKARQTGNLSPIVSSACNSQKGTMDSLETMENVGSDTKDEVREFGSDEEKRRNSGDLDCLVSECGELPSLLGVDAGDTGPGQGTELPSSSSTAKENLKAEEDRDAISGDEMLT